MSFLGDLAGTIPDVRGQRSAPRHRPRYTPGWIGIVSVCGQSGKSTRSEEDAATSINLLSIRLLSQFGQPSVRVVSGPHDALEKLSRAAGELGVRNKRLLSPYPYHNRMMDPVARELAVCIADLPVHSLIRPVYSTLHRRYYRPDDDVSALMSRHLVMPVAFLESVRALHAEGTDFFVEAGALTALTGIVRTAVGQIHTVAPLDHAATSEEFTSSLAPLPGLIRPTGRRTAVSSAARRHAAVPQQPVVANAVGQRLAVTRARHTDRPRQVGWVIAHGTGTRGGDTTELRVLQAAGSDRRKSSSRDAMTPGV